MMIDSLDMTDADRALIVDAVPRRPPNRGSLITHGTDTMVETAAALARGAAGRRPARRSSSPAR